MPLRGRGAAYSRARHVVEWTLGHAYRGNWPARLTRALGMQRRVRVRHHEVIAPRWPVGAPPVRIAFVSDLHVGPTTHPSLHAEAFALIEAARPDVVLLGGDYVYLSAGGIDALAVHVARLPRPPLGIFGVMGNHDLWADDTAIARALTAAGARMLINERVELLPHLTLVGVDDPWTGRAPELPLFPADRDATRLVLVHAPEIMLRLRHEPFDLALCGHTHGGHVALPGEVPLVAPGPLSRRYAHGRYDVGDGRTLIVSRGVGSADVALRTFADPDVLVVDLCGTLDA